MHSDMRGMIEGECPAPRKTPPGKHHGTRLHARRCRATSCQRSHCARIGYALGSPIADAIESGDSLVLADALVHDQIIGLENWLMQGLRADLSVLPSRSESHITRCPLEQNNEQDKDEELARDLQHTDRSLLLRFA